MPNSSNVQISLPASGSLSVFKRKASGDSLTRSLLCIVNENNPTFGTFFKGAFLVSILLPMVLRKAYSKHTIVSKPQIHFVEANRHMQILRSPLQRSLRLLLTSYLNCHRQQRPLFRTMARTELVSGSPSDGNLAQPSSKMAFLAFPSIHTQASVLTVAFLWAWASMHLLPQQ